MGLKQAQYFCRHCRKHTLHQAVTYDVPHVFHLLMTALLCGFWLPVWLVHIVLNELFDKSPFRCTQCGQAAGELTPAQLAVEKEHQQAEAGKREIARRVAAERRRTTIATIRRSIEATGAGIGSAVLSIVLSLDRVLQRISGDDTFFRAFLWGVIAFLAGLVVMVLIVIAR